jgi:hypothetical protein
VFKLQKNGTFTTLVNFDGTNGGRPNQRLAIDSLGQIYGNAASGGPNDRGAVFKVAKAGFVSPGVDIIPEPGNWAMLIVGFAIVGGMQRRLRRSLV